MATILNATTSSGLVTSPDNSGVIQFQSNGTNTVQIAADGTMSGSSGANIAAGSLIRAPQILTTGTLYTTPANCNNVFVELVGGGGGGYTSAGNVGGSGGGGGGYASSYLPVSPSTGYSFTIGGVGAAGAPGNTGGTTTITFGANTVTATGGGPGTVGASGGGAGGIGTSGQFLTKGSAGQTGNSATNAAGSGGASFFGGGGVRETAGGQYGGGGGGGGASVSAGAGAQGVIRIWEYK